jgi:hypothetical protein
MDFDQEYRRITSTPSEDDKQRCQIYAYVGAELLTDRESMNIRCNCGASVPYQTSTATNVAECGSCGTIIGLLGVEGGPGAIEYSRPDGTTGAVPVQGYD